MLRFFILDNESIYPLNYLNSLYETFEKRSILFKVKEGENFNRLNTLSISRIKI